MALLAEPDNAAAHSLGRLGLAAQPLRDQLWAPASPAVEARPRTTPSFARVMRGARAARSLRGDELIGNEHVLIALLAEWEGGAARLIVAAGLDPSEVARAAMADLQRGVTRRGPAPPVAEATPT